MKKTPVKIVVSSPKDVAPERDCMEKVIAELNDIVAADRNVVLELVRWEKIAHPGHHEDGPQGLIDPLLMIEHSDVLVGIFWTRFGTPAMGALSGTEHEIRTAIASKEQRGRPRQVMIYFKEAGFTPQSEEERSQCELVAQFRKKLPLTVLPWTFRDVSDFEDLVRKQLGNFLKSQFDLPGRSQTEDACLRKYCEKIQKRFSTIFLFGHQASTNGEGQVGFDQMTSIKRGFVSMHLSEWGETTDETTAIPIGTETLCEQLFSDEDGPRPILVSGLPGSGKTTLLRYLGYRIATRALEDGKERVPVYLRLRDFRCSKTTLEKLVSRQLTKDGGLPGEADVLCDGKRFLRNSMVLLLDGVDEIEDPETAGKIAELLDEFVKDYPQCKLVVTSRPIGWKREDYREFTALDLRPLSQDMVDDYLDRWFAAKPEGIKKLRAIFKDRARIRALSTNTFLLSMICYTFEHGGKTKLVERRSQLYETCTRCLLKRSYDRESHAPTPGRADGQEDRYVQALELLKDLSLRFFLWQEEEFGVDHANVIGRHNPTAPILGETALFLDRLERETGLVQRVEKGYTFIHRSLWEYFTALALLSGKKPDFVIRYAANPDWEEVVRLYAGLLPGNEEVRKLVEGLWTSNRPLALRVTTEVETPPAELIGPLIQKEPGNQSRLLLMGSLDHSLPLLAEGERRAIVEETLRIMLIGCGETNCEVVYHAQALLDRFDLKPLAPGGVIHEFLDLANVFARQERLLKDPANQFEWVKVDGGIFEMGDNHHFESEAPAHPVKVQTFLMAKHPVTNHLLASFPLGQKYSNYYGAGDSHPAARNNWYEARYFGLWIGARLPSEAEWEYAARGGKLARPGAYYFGDDEGQMADHAWFGESRRIPHAVDEINPRTGRENLNPLGLANMLGNIREWVEDDYHGSYENPPRDGSAWSDNPRGSERVVRGGAWDRGARYCRSASRSSMLPGDRREYVGFRLARSLP